MALELQDLVLSGLRFFGKCRCFRFAYFLVEKARDSSFGGAA